jgi:hypothetical protein
MKQSGDAVIHLRITVSGEPFFAFHVSDVERLHAPLADLLSACRRAGQACLILAEYGNIVRIVGRA